ncbi:MULTISPECIES: TetR/AcrR family transcriptional regulator [Actinoplanes]|uniref:TetR/AcrR family transcriptional regulator n=1 Tax=Actinoplanes TaxID=1865 RepID=UPI0005F2F3F9|nr:MULTISPECIES: TetR/AcrR family transcriptional regulator [Actinoplanes]GLX99712.1 hypothetical protein Acsp01_00920 [Actinoplanes sp. NBRC 101535]
MKTLRAGSPAKRAAILVAARELFLRDGVDRVSMDAVAARAAVSKRTVYDYFGDKRTLFLAILADAADSLNGIARRAIDEHLPDDPAITTVAGLGEALTALAVDLSMTVVRSTDYAAVFALVAQQRGQEGSPGDDVDTLAVHDAVADRFARFAGHGLLELDDPREAAHHFGALTLLLASDEQPFPSRADPERIRRTVTGGVRAFMRAYAPR